MSGIDAIVFDLGNVLLAFDETIARDRMAARIGKTPGEVEAYFRSTPHVMLLSLGKLPARQFYRTAAKDLGFAGEYEEFALIFSDIFTPIQPMLDLAAGLAQRLPRMILSNTNVLHMEFVHERFPAIQEFDDTILSHEVGLLKPDRAIFELAARRSGFEAGRMLFIDDIAANVEGARGAGMQALRFEGYEALRQELTKLGIPII
jgi:glucose-1-phosphatase